MSRSSARRYGLVAALAIVAFAVGQRPTRNGGVHRAEPSRVASGPTISGPAVLARGGRAAGFDDSVTGRRAPRVASSRGDIVGDELIIRPARRSQAAAEAIAELGGSVVWIGRGTGLLLARFATVDDAVAARAMLTGDERIGGIFENRIMEGASLPTTAADARALQWHLAAMKAPAARSAAGVTVAVLDSGVAYEAFSDASGAYAKAPDLEGVAFAPGWDFIHDDAHANDDHGHGTHIASVIAASGPASGVALGATILPVKVLDQGNIGTELGLAEGIRYAVDHGADVINLSLSFQPGYFPSRFLQDAIDHAASHGVVLVAAAGNQGGNVVTYPASFRDVIAVGSSRIWSQYRSPAASPWQQVDQFLRRAEYSNRGQRLDLVAPGGAPDGDANGDGLPESVVAGTFASGAPSQFFYRLWAGTSQAAAEVSGVAALMLAANPSLTPAQIRAILGETAAPEMGQIVLSSVVGRGFLRADAAIAAATAGIGTRARFAAAVRVALVAPDGTRRGRATVEILDGDGRPVPGAQVYGTFTGGVYAAQRAVTGADGTATFLSPSIGTAPVVAFQVDAVADRLTGSTQVFDRPSGALRIDSCSLQLLSQYAQAAHAASVAGAGGTGGSAIVTSPANGTAIVTSPNLTDAGVDNAIITSPNAAGAGIVTSPAPGTLQGPVVISGAGIVTSPVEIPTSVAGTSGAGIVTSPGPVTLTGTDSEAAGAAIVTSPAEARGAAIVTSPNSSAFSSTPLTSSSELLALKLPAASDETASVVLVNLSWNGATLPMAVVADAAWFEQVAPEAHVAEAFGQAIVTSPLRFHASESFDTPMPALPADAACSPLLVSTFVGEDVAAGEPAVAPGECTDTATCAARAASMDRVWNWAAGQGIVTSPRQAVPPWTPESGYTESEYERIVSAVAAWTDLTASTGGAPVADYDELLASADLDAAGGGSGAGIVTSPGPIDGPSCGPDLGGATLPASLVADPAALSEICQPE